MAVRREVNGRILISAGKTYTMSEGLKDIAGRESEGVEDLMARALEEALTQLKEDERIVDMSSGFFTKNAVTHFWVVLVAERRGEKVPASAAASEAEHGG